VTRRGPTRSTNALTGRFDLFAVNPDPSAGLLQVGLSRSAGPLFGRGSGSVLAISFRVRDDAPTGPAVLNLRHGLGTVTTQLNEGGLDLSPDPSDEEGDILDGLITVQKRANAAGPSGVRRHLAKGLVDRFFQQYEGVGLLASLQPRRRRPGLPGQVPQAGD
jgi:hypothetical protein